MTDPTRDLAVFQQMVWQDLALQAALRDMQDEAAFCEAVCAAAQAYGLALAPAALRETINAARRMWIERWIR